VLECTNLEFFYATSHPLKSVSFNITEGSLVSLFGQNGSGKTTLLKMLGGSLPIRTGEFRLFDQCALDSSGYLRNDLRHLVGVLFQNTSSDEKLSAFHNLFYSVWLKGMSFSHIEESVQQALVFANLLDRAYEPVKKLSGGMRRRLELYRTFMHNPKLVLLDEPTTGLDLFESARFFLFLKNYVKRTNAVVIMSTHHPDDVLSTERVIMMRDGTIIADQSPHTLVLALNYMRCSFSLHDKNMLQDFSDVLFDIEQGDAPGVIEAKVPIVKFEEFLSNPILRDNKIKAFSVEKPNLRDVYKDLCRYMEAL
jgi:ABC-2 type transport system ATP-binding protein